MVLTGPEDQMLSGDTPAELLDIAVGHQGETVAVGAPPAVADGFLAHVLGFDARPRPGLSVRAGCRTVVDVGADGRGVIRSLNGDVVLEKLVGESPVDPALCRVIVARHGQSMAVEDGEPVHSHHPIGLTAEGRLQAARLAAALEPVPLDAVYTSDLNRAIESAEPVAAAAGLTPIVMPELREIFLGDLEGMTLAGVHAEHDRFVPWLEVAFNHRFPSQEFHHPAELVFPGGESVASVYERVLDPFLALVRRHRGGTIAVIAHGWVLQPLLCHVLGLPVSSYFRLELPYAAPTVIEIDAAGRGALGVLNGVVGERDGP
jgi:broad specificity phosphatase PhoE